MSTVQEGNLSYDDQIAEAMGEVYADPLGHVMLSYDWDGDASIQMVKLTPERQKRYGSVYGPDAWACEFMEELGREVVLRKFDGKTPVAPIQMATVSGHGIGKSTLVAWLIKWIMDTRPFAKGVVTAMTSEQLRTKTWAEVGKWHRRSLTEHWFTYTSGRGAMSLYHRDFPQEWRCDAQTSREENSESFAGLHSANSTPFYVFDEASGIPEKIFEVREGGTTDGEPMIFDFGNGTRNSGRFYEECEGRFKGEFLRRSIDSRSVSITNKDRFTRWVELYGEDSDFVRVRVKGEFPRAGDLQFVGNDLVEEAMARDDHQRLKTDALVLGVDVARFGDDSSVIWPRLGPDARSFPPEEYKGLDTVQVASRVIDKIRYFQNNLGLPVSAVFIDGGGLGAGVVDHLRATNYGSLVHDVQFGGRADDPQAYRFKVDEMWGRIRDALRHNLVMPRGGDLAAQVKAELTGRQYGYTLKGQLSLESKSDMKDRGLPSPDFTDALAVSYASSVDAVDAPALDQEYKVEYDYDPLEAA